MRLERKDSQPQIVRECCRDLAAGDGGFSCDEGGEGEDGEGGEGERE